MILEVDSGTAVGRQSSGRGGLRAACSGGPFRKGFIGEPGCPALSLMDRRQSTHRAQQVSFSSVGGVIPPRPIGLIVGGMQR